MSSTIPSGINLTVLVGTLTRAPELRPLPSGETVLSLELTVPRAGGAAESVPVSWLGALAAATRWKPGEELLVTGRTRRRFFRAGGVTQSRTEVVASVVVPTRRAVAARSALDAALQAVVSAGCS